MADQEFQFTVTVRVSDWPDDQVAATAWPARTPQDYAEAALNEAGLKEAHHTDGFADFRDFTGPRTDARITDVEFKRVL